MKKTININLAGIHFHIDEDAFQKLSSYFDSIRRSLKNAEGSEEILNDIEARIAELFSEKINSNKQVVTLREVDEIISIMGQPEDYKMDDEFEEEPQSTTFPGTSTKKLFRDIDNKYIGGVSSGLGHYLGIDAIWIRLIWILLILAGMGSPILVYIILWILIPAAITTSDKLKMTGDPINISNIEKKFKDGFENVANSVKNANYGKYGSKFKSGIGNFFDKLASVFNVLFTVLVKFIGILLIIISIGIFISLITGLFFLGNVYFMDQIVISNYFIYSDQYPYWLFVTLIFIGFGIPLFALFVGGLKLLISHLKPIGTTVKILLLVFWIISIIGLIIIALAQYQETAFFGKTMEEKTLNISSNDTLDISISSDHQFEIDVYRKAGLKIKVDTSGNPVFYSNDILLNFKSSKDSLTKFIIDKRANGNSFLNAKTRAEEITYDYQIINNNLKLNGFFTTNISNKHRNQEIEMTLLIPENTVLHMDPKVNSYISSSSRFRGKTNMNSQYYRYKNNEFICLDCPDKIIKTEDSIQTNSEEEWEIKVKEKLNE